MTGDEKFVSVNLPSGDRSEIKGVEMTRTGIIRFNDYYHHNESGSCLKGTLREVVNAYDSDVECLKRGCISVSILRISFDVTSAEPDKRLKLCW